MVQIRSEEDNRGELDPRSQSRLSQFGRMDFGDHNMATNGRDLLMTSSSHKNGGGSDGDVLSKFEEAKNEMIKYFLDLQKTTKAVSVSFNEFSKVSTEVDLEEELRVEPVKSAIEQIDCINDVISRDQMKVVFFGRTSSGKSTIANAILSGKILPVGMGDTTNCFITMQGTTQPEPYMIHPSHPDTPQSVHSVAQLAHAMDKNKLQRSSQLMMFWPSSRVELLKHDLILIDSPGISVDTATDLWIDQYCLDADVFIFCANAESTLMETEKQFFHKVSQHLSKPNMFILQNKWDLADCSDVDPHSVKQQHVERSVEFLVDELKVMDDAIEAEKRVFFVSAKEELNYRIQESKGEAVTIQGEYRDAIAERRREFRAFEADFKYCVCDTAIKTKFEKHTQKGLEIMSKVEQLLKTVTESAKTKRAREGDRHGEVVRQYKQMKTRAKKMDASQKEELIKFANQVQANIATVMGDEVLQLTLILEKFPKPFPSDPSGIPQYKQELFQFVDKELKNAIDARYRKDIVNNYEQLRRRLIESAEQILSREWVSEQSKPVSVDLLRNERVSPDMNFSFSCQTLCANFREDLSFNFSLGINNIITRFTGPVMSRNMMRKAAKDAKRRASQALSEITQEGDQSFASSSSSAQDQSGSSSSDGSSPLLPVLAALSMMPSLGPVGLVVVGGILWSKISWRVIAIVGGFYGGFYLYERLTWNVVAKQKSFKRQLVSFATPQLSSVIPLVSQHCSDILVSDVQNVYSSLRVDVDASLVHTRKQIENCEQKMKSLTDIVDFSTNYIAKIHNHEQQFSSFLQRFLQSGSH